jgi:hypothetical protein
LTEQEWKSLIPARPKKGESSPVPPAIAKRILRFHLVDNTRGEPGYWREKEIHDGRLSLSVEEATADGVELRLQGRALLATHADPARAQRGFDVSLLGHIHYDVAKKSIDRFDVLAIGTRWGANPWSTSRPGRTPLGIYFELARGGCPADRVPPQAARDWRMYVSGEGD